MSPATILVVDDERPLRELLMSLLEEEGYEVRLAIHGRDALARIEEAVPDLIIMDLMMPVMGGADLYRRLKGRSETRTIPVIVMSAGLGKPVELTETDAFIAKPFDLLIMESIVRERLEAR